MKNKKGFTLVELLAVIVILGVLLLIAVPSATKIIDNSRKKSFLSAADLAISNVETTASLETIGGASITACYIPLSDLEADLERGSFGKDYKGYVLVDTTGAATIYYSNDKFSISGKKSSDLAIDATLTEQANAPSAPAGGSAPVKCSWY